MTTTIVTTAGQGEATAGRLIAFDRVATFAISGLAAGYYSAAVTGLLTTEDGKTALAALATGTVSGAGAVSLAFDTDTANMLTTMGQGRQLSYKALLTVYKTATTDYCCRALVTLSMGARSGTTTAASTDTAASLAEAQALVDLHNSATAAHPFTAADKVRYGGTAGATTEADITALARTLLARATAALMRGDIGAYRIAATTAVGNVSGSVTSDFAASLTNTYTLTANCTVLPLPTNLADAETGVALFTLAGFSMPAGPAATAYKGNWTVTGTHVRVIWERIGALYFVSADSLTVVP
jgi:hypothetical protein